MSNEVEAWKRANFQEISHTNPVGKFQFFFWKILLFAGKFCMKNWRNAIDNFWLPSRSVSCNFLHSVFLWRLEYFTFFLSLLGAIIYIINFKLGRVVFKQGRHAKRKYVGSLWKLFIELDTLKKLIRSINKQGCDGLSKLFCVYLCSRWLWIRS